MRACGAASPAASSTPPNRRGHVHATRLPRRRPRLDPRDDRGRGAGDPGDDDREGLVGTPLPLLLAADEGPLGTFYGHVARANPQWRLPPVGEALAIFAGADAYVSPGRYAAKAEHGRVVPTWNYAAVHAYGVPEFFEDAGRLRALVGRLTDRREAGQAQPWSVDDAPEAFVQGQLGGIVGVRLRVARLEGKREFSQNRSAADREGVVRGLRASGDRRDAEAAAAVPIGETQG